MLHETKVMFGNDMEWNYKHEVECHKSWNYMVNL